MKILWQRTSSGIGLLFVALGVILAGAHDRDPALVVRPGAGPAD
jgi:hypothetical protein